MDQGTAGFTLVDVTTGQPITAQPLRLSSLAIRPFAQPPPPALASGLRQLLQQASAAARAGGSGEAPASSSGGGVSLSSGLRLLGLAEHADRFLLDLQVSAELGGTLSSSGLSVHFPDALRDGGACMQVQASRP